jgi:hypothetical protein
MFRQVEDKALDETIKYCLNKYNQNGKLTEQQEEELYSK